jgi:hypothetical protein
VVWYVVCTWLKSQELKSPYADIMRPVTKCCQCSTNYFGTDVSDYIEKNIYQAMCRGVAGCTDTNLYRAMYRCVAGVMYRDCGLAMYTRLS